jgi:GTP-binding protein HflX
MSVPGMGEVVLVDTVGFIRHLPHKLVEAFKATLQETQEADLLLHVIDCADDDRQMNMEQVEIVLDEIDALDRPTLQVFNKIDKVPGASHKIDRDEKGLPWRVWVSAMDRKGLELIHQAIGELLSTTLFEQVIEIEPKDGQLRSLLYAHNAVLTESVEDNGNIKLEIRLEKDDFQRLLSRAGVPVERYVPQEKEFWQK